MPKLHLLATLALLLATLLPAQEFPAPWAAPDLERSISIRDGHTDTLLDLPTLLDTLAQADVVFLGETHDNETTHRVELAIYEGLLARSQNKVVLAMEMFERDTQPLLDAYLANEIDETTFLADARPWRTYAESYRPLVEAAKASGAPVIASNFPLPLHRRMAMEGTEVMANFTDEEKAQTPSTYFPNTPEYWKRVDNATRSHRGMTSGNGDDTRLYSTQSLWDNSMGNASAQALDNHPDHQILHVNGGFHSAYWDGTVHQFRHRKPDAKVLTVSIIPNASPANQSLGGTPIADYVIYAEQRATDLQGGERSVFIKQELKYKLHIPKTASQENPVPLLIWLSNDGLSAKEGLELWQDRLGENAAILAIDAPYRSVQEDLSIGRSWYWSDSFSSDMSVLVEGIERSWAYTLRHFPIDPSRICIAGEGTGGTVAATVALLTGRIEHTAIAINPSQYAKIKNFSLPMPEYYGDDTPATRTLQVIANERTLNWWKSELDEYSNVGIPSKAISLKENPWKSNIQLQSAVTNALGLKSSKRKTSRKRRHILIPSHTTRAEHWTRLQAMWATASDGIQTVATHSPPNSKNSKELPTTINPEHFAKSGALPKSPGPFGGTTVIVLNANATEAELQQWLAIEENDPLAADSRFYRIRIATTNGERSLPNVLEKLHAKNRNNILIVPATFYADPAKLRAMSREIEFLADDLTITWLPGLGGSKTALLDQ